MADRACLYAADRPDGWDRPDVADGAAPYFDSRHGIPLAWFFLYGANDVRRHADRFARLLATLSAYDVRSAIYWR